MQKYFASLLIISLAGCFHNGEEKHFLNGVWVSSCYEALPNSQALYGISTMTFSSPNLTQGVTLFSDSSCSQESGHQEEFVFTYMVGNKVMTSGGVEARELITESKDGTIYTIYGLIENKLYFGDLDSIENTNYPTKLEYSVYFTKQ